MSGEKDTLSQLPPEVLLELLEAARAAVPAESRYRDAVSLARSMARLRQERERFGFTNTSWKHYFAHLVEASGIDPLPVLEWSGIRSLNDSGSTRAICRIAQELGIAFDEVVAYVFRGFAEDRNIFVPLANCAENMGEREYAERCALVVEQLDWDQEAFAQLRAIKKEISREYGRR